MPINPNMPLQTMFSNTLQVYLPDEWAMNNMGKLLATSLVNNKAFIYLQGELGAGKTTLVRGFLRGLGYDARVKSPTYTLVESYNIGAKTLYHFDFYRIKDAQELEFIGLGDYLSQEAICLIEWPDLAGNLLPVPDLMVQITVQNSGRIVKIEASSDCGQKTMEQLHNAVQTL